MKSLEELKAIRDKMKGQIGMRSENADNTRVVVGMAPVESQAAHVRS